MGGNIATNAGGLCCVKYGVTTDYVLGLDVVLADGTLVTLGGKRIKDVAGLSLLKLFVGSEGTLGIVTRAILRLVPGAGRPVDAGGDVPLDGGRGRGGRGYDGGCGRRCWGWTDRWSVNAVEDHKPMGLDREAGALLLAQSDAPGTSRGEEVAIMEKACAAAGATEVFVTDDAEEGEMFVAARRAAFPATRRRARSCWRTSASRCRSCPTCWPRSRRSRRGTPWTSRWSPELGDGNTHPIVYPPGDLAAEARARAAFDDIMAAAIRLGGTITGEHGVGRAKKAALPDQLGPHVMALTRRIKDALDPQGILNPWRYPL